MNIECNLYNVINASAAENPTSKKGNA